MHMGKILHIHYRNHHYCWNRTCEVELRCTKPQSLSDWRAAHGSACVCTQHQCWHPVAARTQVLRRHYKHLMLLFIKAARSFYLKFRAMALAYFVRPQDQLEHYPHYVVIKYKLVFR